MFILELSLRDIFVILLSKIWYIILSVLIFAIGAFTISNYFIQPVYQSRLSIYVFNQDTKSKESTTNDLLMAQRLVNSYIALLKSNTFLTDVIRDANLDMKTKELGEQLKMSAITDTELFEIVVSADSPSLALKIANTIVKLAPVKLKEMVHTGTTKVIDTPVIAEKPSSPNILLNTVVGALIGFVGSCMLIVLYDMMDTKIKNKEDIIQRYNIPVIGSVPLLEEGKRDGANKEK